MKIEKSKIVEMMKPSPEDVIKNKILTKVALDRPKKADSWEKRNTALEIVENSSTVSMLLGASGSMTRHILPKILNDTQRCLDNLAELSKVITLLFLDLKKTLGNDGFEDLLDDNKSEIKTIERLLIGKGINLFDVMRDAKDDFEASKDVSQALTDEIRSGKKVPPTLVRRITRIDRYANTGGVTCTDALTYSAYDDEKFEMILRRKESEGFCVSGYDDSEEKLGTCSTRINFGKENDANNKIKGVS